MIITPTQLNNYVKAVFDTDEILLNVVVRGEIANLKNAHGNYYFSLKDECNQVECFSYKLQNIEIYDGLMAEINGSVNFNAKFGRISLFVKGIKAENNVGEQHLRFLKLKEKLQKEGLFDLQRSKSLPEICRTVAVVTSKDGAVIKDIEQVLLRRQPSMNILLYSVHVQGEHAESEICQAIAYFSNSDVDVVIVARGGGSNEDLSAFNSEKVVRAISSCSKPTVSAIGHGSDFTLSDFAADKRAVTPSEAAEFVSVDVRRVRQSICGILKHNSQTICRKKIFLRQKIQDALKYTAVTLNKQIFVAKNSIFADIAKAERSLEYSIQKNKLAVQNIISRVNASNPTNILKRGYLFAQQDGRAVKSVRELQQGQRINLRMFDGNVTAIVEQIVGNEEEAL